MRILTVPTSFLSSMNNIISEQWLDDLHALERFLRGSRPGSGKTFANLLLRSLQNAAEGQPKLQRPLQELTQRVQTFVEAELSASVNAFELWSGVEQALAACRATITSGHHRPSLASGSLLQQAL